MIEAKLRGPGPGRYGLPTTCGHSQHDSTKVSFQILLPDVDFVTLTQN